MVKGLKRNRFVIGILKDDNKIDFVTNAVGSTVSWKAGTQAMVFSKSYAESIVYGLQLNGYHAMLIDPLFLEGLKNPVIAEGIHQD